MEHIPASYFIWLFYIILFRTSSYCNFDGGVREALFDVSSSIYGYEIEAFFWGRHLTLFFSLHLIWWKKPKILKLYGFRHLNVSNIVIRLAMWKITILILALIRIVENTLIIQIDYLETRLLQEKDSPWINCFMEMVFNH